jgi:pyruvate dehydrogenase E1 component alpha subunit
MTVSREQLLDFYESMLLIREFEEKVFELAKRGIVKGSVHLCTGEEACAVGVCSHLEKSDYILPTHRGHGHTLVKGIDPRRFLAEIIGKETGYCKGRVGSMHVFDRETHNLGSQGIVGAQFSLAVGVGLAIKLQELPACAVCFLGDGASNQGWFYESLNLASLWDLPILYVCVNNLYGMGTHYTQTSKTLLPDRARLFGMPAETVNGNDVEAVYEKAGELIAQIKKERKPAFLECMTYRWYGHSAFDMRPYRPKDEIEAWKAKDPVQATREKLIGLGVEGSLIEQRDGRVAQIVAEAEQFALESDYPVYDSALEC